MFVNTQVPEWKDFPIYKNKYKIYIHVYNLGYCKLTL